MMTIKMVLELSFFLRAGAWTGLCVTADCPTGNRFPQPVQYSESPSLLVPQYGHRFLIPPFFQACYGNYRVSDPVREDPPDRFGIPVNPTMLAA